MITPEQFAIWLQGYVELNGTAPTIQQWEIIKDHLKEVFDKRTPNRDNGVSQDNPVHLRPTAPKKWELGEWQVPVTIC